MKRIKRLNVLDLALLLLLLLSLLSLLLRFRMLMRDSDAEISDEWRVVLHFENVNGALADCYRAGERARILNDDVMGEITQVDVIESRQTLISNGAQYEAVWDTDYRCTLQVTLNVRARLSDGVLYLDGRYGRVLSDHLTICTNRTKMTGVIIGYAPLIDPPQA